MKKSIAFICMLFCISVSSTEAATWVLRPSLSTQMQKQSKINTVNLIAEKKAMNLTRLQAIAKKRVTWVQGSVQISTKKVISTPTAISPTKPIVTTSLITVSKPSSVPNVDMSRIHTTIFGWYNDYRRSLGLGLYLHDPRLDITAHDWNIRFAVGKGQNHHTRNPGDGYYNFPVIDTWFAARGINPIVRNRSKHTENVGYGYYTCTSWDCTDSLIAAIHTTWDFFMSEKWKSYDAHYQTIINPYFTKMWYDIIVVPSEQRYYIVLHFITE